MQTYEALAGRTAVVTGAASGMGSAVATPADLADPASIEALADTVHLAIGPDDLVVNAAGVMLPNPIAPKEAPTSGSACSRRTSRARSALVRAFSPDLIKAAAENRAADLVNISSVAAHIPIPEYAVYNASKAAMTHLFGFPQPRTRAPKRPGEQHRARSHEHRTEQPHRQRRPRCVVRTISDELLPGVCALTAP